MSKNKPVRNIAELAAIAGVTPGTVSRALSGKGLLAEATRARIRALAREHNFTPNPVARHLRTQRSYAINVLIPLGHEQTQHLSDPFFMTMLGHLADGLTGRGYELILSKIIPTEDDWLIPFLTNGRADGVMVIGQSDQAPALDRAAQDHLKFVAWGGFYPGQSHCSIGSDNFLGGRLAAEHLIERGCKRIAFFGNPKSVEISQRFEGYKTALKEAGGNKPILCPARLAQDADNDDLNGYLQAEKPLPDGIVASTDDIAVRVIGALSELDAAVPDDVRIVGFDDLPIATKITPRLTTVRQDFKAGAEHMIDCLMRRIEGEETASIVMKPDLVVRRST